MRWNKSPLATLKERFGSKEKLIDTVAGMLPKSDEDEGEILERLRGTANSKLIRLHDLLDEIQERWGGIEPMVDDLLARMKRTKDVDYRQSLMEKSPGRLMDIHRRLTRRRA